MSMNTTQQKNLFLILFLNVNFMNSLFCCQLLFTNLSLNFVLEKYVFAFSIYKRNVSDIEICGLGPISFLYLHSITTDSGVRRVCCQKVYIQWMQNKTWFRLLIHSVIFHTVTRKNNIRIDHVKLNSCKNDYR